MAYELGIQGSLPLKAGKTRVVDVWMYYFVVVHDNKLLVRHRRNSGIWKGLYDFPSVDSSVELSVEEVIRQWKHERSLNGNWLLGRNPIELEHILSHRRVHAVFLELSADKAIQPMEAEQWIALDEFRLLGVSRLVDRYIREHSQLLNGME
jgi:A/G-specific adenine glycosylase